MISPLRTRATSWPTLSLSRLRRRCRGSPARARRCRRRAAFFAHALPVGFVHEAGQGRKPPMPIMIRSPLAREEISICFRPAAFFFSSSKALPSNRQHTRPLPPCGGTSWTSRNPPCFGYGRLAAPDKNARRTARGCSGIHLVNNLTKSQLPFRIFCGFSGRLWGKKSPAAVRPAPGTKIHRNPRQHGLPVQEQGLSNLELLGKTLTISVA